MPKAFDDCVKNGGKVRTMKPSAHTYQHVCIPKGGGSSVMGEIKKMQNQTVKATKKVMKKKKK